jgi:hypothetical protein
MLKLLFTLLHKYIDGDYKRVRGSDDTFTVVIYEVLGKEENGPFTRIDIFTRKTN